MCAACEAVDEFYDHAAKKCIKCDERVQGCDQCFQGDEAEILCSRCHHGYYLLEDEGTCFDCLEHDNKCDRCDSEDCLDCRHGWTLWLDSNYCIPGLF